FFRLYASSKDADEAAAGKYGVGFWSILQWQPTRIDIRSATASDPQRGLAVRIEVEAAQVERSTVALPHQGTEIRLWRPRPAGGADDQCREAIIAGMRRYCRFVRMARSKVPLEVWV